MRCRRAAGRSRDFPIRGLCSSIANRLFYHVLPYLVLCIWVCGCGNKFFDPTQVGRFRPKPAVNLILDSLGVAPETPSAWAGAEEPRPVDVMELQTDYVFNPGDYIRVTIFELLQEGRIFTEDYVVRETGTISIPEVGVIQAQGLTESQLEDEIRDILRPSILKEPSITIGLVRSERRTFSILGDGVGGPGRYFLPRYALRLADALATAGGISEFNVSYIFVSRAVTGKAAEAEPFEPESGRPVEPGEQLEVPEKEMLEIIKPLSLAAQSQLVLAAAEMGTRQEQPGRVEWIFKGGKWVPVRTGAPEPTQADRLVKPVKPVKVVEQTQPPEFGWEQIGAAGVQARVIEIPVDRFQSGDPRYNIVIRPGDTIYVPVDIVGEFYIMGNVNRQGAIPLTGRPMTLKMAIAVAGNLGPLAWPKRCEVIRRLSKDREEIVMVDLEKVFSGEQPDFFIKVNDLINVGTHPTSRWRAVLRNAFRATYGFGFVYDRNFADIDYGQRRLTNWF